MKDKHSEEYISLSSLRSDIYKIFDRLIKSGAPVKVKRKGVIVRIIPEVKKDKFDCIQPLDCVNGDPEDLVDIHWESEWSADDIS